MSVLPSLYISHGSPLTALNPGLVGERLAQLAHDMERPKAIIVASAHFETPEPVIGGALHPETIHDFRGFPQALYEMQYAAPGSPSLAEKIRELLEKAGLAAAMDHTHGLDHGVWEPLTMLYPNADIPVVPISIQPGQGPDHHYRVGKALASLREEGVLLIGSGSITHNLQDFFVRKTQPVEDYVAPFTQWIEKMLRQNDIASLLDYRRLAPFAERAHPTDEHLLPLFFAMGAAGDKVLGATRIEAGVDSGILAMDIYRFDGAISVTNQERAHGIDTVTSGVVECPKA